MAGAINDHLREVALAAQSAATAQAAARAMAEATTTAVARYLGDDLTLSGLKGAGAARIEPRADLGRASVEISGAAFTLVDKGRRTSHEAVARPHSALATPWGPRHSVAGSTTIGKDIMGNSRDEVFSAGGDAVTAEIQRSVT